IHHWRSYGQQRSSSRQTLDSKDVDGWSERLFVGRRELDLFHDVHSGCDLAERGETLPVRITLAREIEFRLVADTDEEIASSSIRPAARHRDGSVAMPDAGNQGALE